MEKGMGETDRGTKDISHPKMSSLQGFSWGSKKIRGEM